MQKESGHHGRSKESSYPFINFCTEHQLPSDFVARRIYSLYSYQSLSSRSFGAGHSRLRRTYPFQGNVSHCVMRGNIIPGSGRKIMVALHSACICMSLGTQAGGPVVQLCATAVARLYAVSVLGRTTLSLEVCFSNEE